MNYTTLLCVGIFIGVRAGILVLVYATTGYHRLNILANSASANLP